MRLTTLEQQNIAKLKQHVQDLERSFVTVLEKSLEQRWKNYPVTLIEFNRTLGYYTSEDFWSKFSADVCQEANAVGLLTNPPCLPYIKALTTLEQENAGKLTQHIQNLEGMFVSLLEKALIQKWKNSLVTLTEYDQALKHYASKDFWSVFSANLCCEHGANDLLQESAPYTKALATLTQQNIEKRTEQRTREVISSLIPAKEGDNFITFDFAYHREFHDQVCGLQAIGQITTDPIEQEVARSCYAGVISQHSHGQMVRWHEKFGGAQLKNLLQEFQLINQQSIENLTKQLEATQIKLKATQEELTGLQKEKESWSWYQQEQEKKRIARELAEREVKEAAQRQAREAAERARRAEEERIREAKRLQEEQRLIELRRNIPEIAYGYEDIYQRFLNGRLIYKPNKDNDIGKIELRIC